MPAPEWLIIAVAVVAIVLLLMVAAVWRSSQHNRQQLKRLNREIAVLQRGAIGMGQRILTMESRGNQAANSKNLAIPDNSLRPYSEATHLLSLGLDRDEVASRCGLSRAEASLLEALHKKPTA